MMKVLTKEEAQTLKSYSLYENGDYSYKTKDGFVHLIVDGVDLLEGKKAIRVWDTGHKYLHILDYAYETEDGYYNVLRNKTNILNDKTAICLFTEDGYYRYQTECKTWYLYRILAVMTHEEFYNVAKKIKKRLNKI